MLSKRSLLVLIPLVVVKTFPHSASLKYSYSRGELLALVVILCLLGPVLVLVRCLYNFSFNFPWSRDVKDIFCASRSACV